MLRRVRLVVQPGAVDKMRLLHPQLRCPLVHELDECRLAAGYMLRQCRGAVVGRGDDDGLEHIPQRQLLSRFQIDLAATLGRRGVRGRYRVVPTDLAAVQRLQDQEQRHDFRYAGRGQPCVGILLPEDRPRGGVH